MKEGIDIKINRALAWYAQNLRHTPQQHEREKVLRIWDIQTGDSKHSVVH